MQKNIYYKEMFFIAAIFNWILGIYGILSSLYDPYSSSYYGLENPPSLIWFHLAFCFVILFGILFYKVGRNLEKYHDMTIIFVAEKFTGFFVVLIYFLIGDINIYGTMFAVVDLIFGCLFLEFFLKFKKD